MTMHGHRFGKDFKNVKSLPSSLATEIRAYKKYADCDKKRTSKCVESIKPFNNILYSAK